MNKHLTYDEYFDTYYKPTLIYKNYFEQVKEIDELQQKLQRKDNIIKIMENYLELIYDLGYDHDGCESTGDLMSLIDEIVKYASLGRVYNTTETIYVNGNDKYNILHEKIKGECK
jgi:hypothetical protein